MYRDYTYTYTGWIYSACVHSTDDVLHPSWYSNPSEVALHV